MSQITPRQGLAFLDSLVQKMQLTRDQHDVARLAVAQIDRLLPQEQRQPTPEAAVNPAEGKGSKKKKKE